MTAGFCCFVFINKNLLLSGRGDIVFQSQELLLSSQFDGIISLGKRALHFFEDTYSI